MKISLTIVKQGIVAREKRWATKKLTTVKAECTFKDIAFKRKRFLEDDGN